VEGCGRVRSRKLVREAETLEEPGHHERGHLLHPGALQREHLERLGHVAAVVGIPAVGCVRRLAVRLRRQVAMAGRGGEGGDDLATAPPGRIRRHLEGDVVCEHGRERVDVAPFPGIQVALHDRADALVSQRAEGGLLAARRHPLLDPPPRPLQRAVHRGDRGLQRPRGLLGREAEHVAEQEHGALRSREVLQGRDERELDGLTLLVASLGGGVSVLQPDGLVRVGLHPDRLSERFPRFVAGVGGMTVLDREASPAPSCQRVEADVGRDPVQPGAQQLMALEPRQRPPGPQQGLLEGVVGVEQRAEHPVAVGVERRPVGLDEAAERVLVPLADSVEEPRLRRPIPGHGRKATPGTPRPGGEGNPGSAMSSLSGRGCTR
jgi:hypothetical protein